jgi:hypothetical protein
MLDGAMLRGRYGGGGSSRLLPSANGSLAEVTDTISDVSMPVRYAPLVPDGIGPKMIGREDPVLSIAE